MLQLNDVGVLLRDGSQHYPLDTLRTLFDRVGCRVHVLGGALPEQTLDLIIAMGGDGTVLQALDLHPNCPVLAVNFGTVGFLTAGDRTELETLVERLLAGDYLVSERLLLRCTHPGGAFNVVNEVVLHTSWRMINVEVIVNGSRIRTIRGDGVIVGTPTGSTGYLLSTGGPIVMPDAECFMLGGINEYNFTSRAVVLPAQAEVLLHLPSLLPEQEVHLYLDGRKDRRIEAGEDIRVAMAQHRAQLIFFDEHYFFHNLSSRLSWN